VFILRDERREIVAEPQNLGDVIAGPQDLGIS
jgi:hypothetical protein